MNSAAQTTAIGSRQTRAPLADVIMACLEDAKSEEIVTIDLIGKTTMADAMVIASGRSKRHVSAIASKLLKTLKEKGHKGAKVEGLDVGEWVLIDAGDIIVHVFQPEIREFYNLEKMWSAERPDVQPI